MVPMNHRQHGDRPDDEHQVDEGESSGASGMHAGGGAG
jgi:hypothetical protein